MLENTSDVQEEYFKGGATYEEYDRKGLRDLNKSWRCINISSGDGGVLSPSVSGNEGNFWFVQKALPVPSSSNVLYPFQRLLDWMENILAPGEI